MGLFIVGKKLFPYEGTDYKATPFGNDAEAKLSRKVGKASLKFKLMREEVGQSKVII